MQSASLLAVPLLAQIAWAQSPTSPSQSAPATIHVDTQFVLLDALVENKKTGRTMDTLPPQEHPPEALSHAIRLEKRATSGCRRSHEKRTG
jgi:hypothetical protein